MNWKDAATVARNGSQVRRSGWTDRWVSYAQCLWWITPFNQATRVSSTPRVMQSTDWTAAEFAAADWTTDDIPALGEGIAEVPADPLSLTVTVPAKSCLLFAYAPSDYVMPTIPVGEVTSGGNTPVDTAEVSAPVIVPIQAGVSSISITASGQWFWGPWTYPDGDSRNTNVGPDGDGGDPFQINHNYFTADANSLNVIVQQTPVSLISTPAAMSSRVASVDPYGVPLKAQQLVGLWINPSQYGPIFVIGSSLVGLPVPKGVTGIALGLLGNYGWVHYSGSMSAKITFTP